MAQLQPELLQNVLRFIQEHKLIAEGEKLVVAVSGGPDSVCLLHVLAALKDELGIMLHVAHLNHELRGAESAADARYVAELAKNLGLPTTIESRDVRAYQVEHRLSLEEAAREVRYHFLAQVARETGAERVAVGHTRDDHIETILMHLIRGSGTRGLRGLQPVSAWQVDGGISIIHPLLEVSRQETVDYCERHQLAPRLDTTNLSLSLFRNRIRLELLPLLKTYNPGIAEALTRTAQLAGDEIAFLDSEAQRRWKEIVNEKKGLVSLNRQKLQSEPPALQRHIIRLAIEKLIGNMKDIEARHIEDILEALDKSAGKRLTLPDGLVFSIGYDAYVLSTSPIDISPLPPLEGETPLNVPGKTEAAGWVFTAWRLTRDQATGMLSEDCYTAFLDADKIGDKLTVRARRRGDMFQPLGMKQPKRLSVFMIDKKVPHADRDRTPLVCAGERIVWVVGVRIDERMKVTGETKQVVMMKAEWVEHL